MILCLIILIDIVTSIDGDISFNSDRSLMNRYDQATENEKTLKYCKFNDKGKTNHCLGDPSFRSIVAYKTNCRLGNHIWAYMHLMYVYFGYKLTIIAEEHLKLSLLRVFKNINHISIAGKDTCGYLEFFKEYEDAIEASIARFLEEKSGKKVSLEKSIHGITIYPEEVAESYGYLVVQKMNEFELQILKDLKANYTSHQSNCKYKVSCKLRHYYC